MPLLVDMVTGRRRFMIRLTIIECHWHWMQKSLESLRCLIAAAPRCWRSVLGENCPWFESYLKKTTADKAKRCGLRHVQGSSVTLMSFSFAFIVYHAPLVQQNRIRNGPNGKAAEISRNKTSAIQFGTGTDRVDRLVPIPPC